MEISDLENIKIEAQNAINQACNQSELDLVWKKYLDKNGILGEFFKSLGNLSAETRGVTGIKANGIKQEISANFEQKSQEIKEKLRREKQKNNEIDVTLPAKELATGRLHPLTKTINRISEIFHGFGFEIIDTPEIENEWYSFDALNIPQNHPTRDSWDTLFLADKTLLRPHTSPGQIHYMENHQPPMRVLMPGRCFRRDAVDASHMPNFYQVEGFWVDKTISVANFKAVIEEFFRQFFSDSEKDSQKLNCKVRLRPSYFPFTEPSFEVDLACVNCGQKGCSACKGTGWMEIMGAGMIHPNVFKNSGIEPSLWQGFAFGMGVERLAMIKYKINDIRLFYDGEKEFLKQF